MTLTLYCVRTCHVMFFMFRGLTLILPALPIDVCLCIQQILFVSYFFLRLVTVLFEKHGIQHDYPEIVYIVL